MLPLQGAQIPSLVGELRFQMPCGAAKKKRGAVKEKDHQLLTYLKKTFKQAQVTDSGMSGNCCRQSCRICTSVFSKATSINPGHRLRTKTLITFIY